MRANRSFFGKKFEEIAIKKNLSQKDVANKLGVSKEMISIWVTGRRNPSLNSIKKIATVFDVPTNYFIEDKEKESVSKKVLDEKDIKILQLEKENLELKNRILEMEKSQKNY